MLTLRPAFETGDRLELIEQVTRQAPPAPRSLDRRIPRDLETIVRKAMAREPVDRYAGAGALAEDLRLYLADRPILARRASTVERAWRWSKRNPLPAALTASVAVLLTALAAGGTWAAWTFAEKAETESHLRADAIEAQGVATAKAKEAQDRANDLERSDYVHKVSLAYREVLNDNVSLAEYLLFSCPARLRGWEWHYVMRLCNLDRLTYQGHNRSHFRSVNRLAISPDGAWIASGSGVAWTGGSSKDSVVVRVWDTDSGRDRLTLEGLTGAVQDIAISPDGKLIAVGGGHYDWPKIDSWLTLRDASTGRPLQAKPPRVEGATVTSVAFLPPHGRTLVAGYDVPDKKDAAGFVALYDTATGEERGRFDGPVGGVSSMAVHPDGHRIAIAGRGPIEVWDIQTRTRTRTLLGHDNWVYALAFNRDGKLATGGWDQSIRVWDPDSGTLLGMFHGHKGFIYGLAFSPDGRSLASASEDRSVRHWDLASGRELASFHGHGHFVFDVAFHPDGRRIASCGMDQTVKVWDVKTNRPVTIRAHNGWVSGVAFRPDGRRLASESKAEDVGAVYGEPLMADGQVRVWDPETGEEDGTGRGYAHIADAAPGPSGKIRVRYAVSPDRSRYAICSPTGEVNVYDAGTRRHVSRLFGHTMQVVNVAFTPDGSRIATASSDRTIRLWDPETGEEVFTLQGHTAGVTCLAFSPGGHGNRLASGGIDYTVRFWDATPLAPEVLREREATWIAFNLYVRMPLKEEVIEHIQADPELDETTRAAALAAAERLGMQFNRLRNSIRELVFDPGRGRDEYTRALRRARALAEHHPEDPTVLSALGMALFRTGSYREGLAKLQEADAGFSKAGPNQTPSNLAFLAMAHHRLGQVPEARARLAQLRTLMKTLPEAGNPILQSLFHEAEALIDPKATK
jgi:WD40 repeat protein